MIKFVEQRKGALKNIHRKAPVSESLFNKVACFGFMF